MGLFRSAAGYLERAASKLTKGGRVAAVKPPPLWLNMGRIGGELSPEEVSAILLRADGGDLCWLIDLARESREKDCHLHACLSTLELSLSGMDVQVIPATEKRRDRKIAAWVDGFLGNFGPREEDDQAVGLADLVAHLAGGYYYSHSVAELIYEKRNGQLIPVAADPVQPRRFGIDPDTSRLVFLEHGTSYGSEGIDLAREYPNRFIQFQPRVLGTGPAREGLMRPLTWAALFRSWGMRDWLALAELAWKPYLIGSYDKGKFATDADIKSLIAALEYLTTNGRTMLPDTVDLRIEWPAQKGSGHDSQHQAMLEFMAGEMSKASLGQTMTTEDGSSKSQASVHREVQKDRRNAMARAIASVIRWQIVARAVRLNFGNEVPIPKVVLTSNDVDLAKLATVLVQLSGPKGIGLAVATRWIYQMFGMPAPQPGDEVVGNATPAHVPTDEERAAAEAAAAQVAAQQNKVRFFEEHLGKMRVRLLDDDRDIREAALAEAEERAATEAAAIEQRLRRHTLP